MGRPAISRRSCDFCRTRKIACDRGSPCANCQNARLDCTHSPIAARHRDDARKPPVSSDYDDRLAQIASSVSGLWNSVHNLQARQDASPRPSQPLSAPLHSPASPPQSTRHHDSRGQALLLPAQPSGEMSRDSAGSSPSVFEGESSFRAHSFRIYKILGHRIREETNQPCPEADRLFAALDRLSILFDGDGVAQEMAFAAVEGANASDEGGKASDEDGMPTLDAALMVLRWAKENLARLSGDMCVQILPLDETISICHKVYFAVDKPGDMELIIATGGLASLFSSYALANSDPKYHVYARSYISRLQGLLGRIPMILPTSLDTVAALATGAVHAVEQCKTALAWSLTSMASSHCQTLGYHRASSMRNDDAVTRARKQQVFWTIFRIDKSLSLRLGRSSAIQEWDVPLPRDPTAARNVRLAHIYGQTYEQLYSLAGLALSDEQRSDKARLLAAEWQQLSDECDEADELAQSSNNQIGQLSRASHWVGRLSIQTLICRAISNTPGDPGCFSVEAINAAHATLAAHQRCIQLLEAHSADPHITLRHFNSAVHCTPFVAFIISFCRVMDEGDLGELDRIDEFTRSLESLRQAAGLQHIRSQRLFGLLYEIAKLHVEYRAVPSVEKTAGEGVSRSYVPDATSGVWEGQSQDQTCYSPPSPGRHESDPPLATAVGGLDATLCGPSAAGDALLRGAEEQGLKMGNGLSDGQHLGDLESWFYANQHLMELMDAELTMF